MSNQIVISSGAKVRSLEGVLTGTAGIVNSVPLGGANGVATLDSNGKVPLSQLPASVVTYLGTWNAATNTPTLANGTGDVGDLYICNVAGTVNFGAGPITFAVGDWVIYNGSEWQKSSGASGTVTSVAVTESGDALNITGSPITTAGTINIGFAGNSGQYINGEGNLTTFPSLITEAQNLVTEVYNETGATLTKGTIVYINGGHGNLPTVTKAIATGDSTSAQTYGVVRADISNNNNGYVTVIGSLSDIDTQAYAAGTQLYLSGTTAGAWTSTKPSAPIHLVYVGIVVRSHPTQGVVEIRIQNGYELEELHDVAISSPLNNQGIFYNSSTDLWENKSIATALGYTPADDSLVVHKAGTETITGTKTFTSYNTKFSKVIVDDGSDATTVAFKQYEAGLFGQSGYTSLAAQGTDLFYINWGATKSAILDSVNLTTDRTYTLPNSDGTLALTSDIPSLSGYVPYTGATANLNLGSYQLFGGSLNVMGDGSTYGGVLNFKQYSSISGGGLDYTTIFAQQKYRMWFDFNQSAGVSKSFVLDVSGLTNSTPRQYYMPNADGTIALTSDIPSLANYVTLTGSQTITGIKTFTNEQLFGNGITLTGGYITYTSGAYNLTLNTNILTANRNIFLQDGSGTLAFTSDIPSLSGYVQGSGTTNYHAKFTAGSTIGNSMLTDDGTTLQSIGATRSNLYLKAASSSYYGQLAFTNGSNGSFGGISYNNSGQYMQFETNSSEWMRLTSDGKLGIGTTSPSVKLEISSSGEMLRLRTSSTDNYVAFFNSAGSQVGDIGYDSRATDCLSIWNLNNAPILFGTNSSERMRITSSGNVGIGTSSPVAFTNYNTVSVNGAEGGAFVTMSNGTSALRLLSGSTDSALWEPRSVPVLFATANTERMRITSSGNVGIGTSSPSSIFEVAQTNSIITQRGNTGYSVFRSYAGDGSSSDVVEFQIRNRVDGSNMVSIGNFTSHDLTFRTANTERMRITSGGALYCGGVYSATGSNAANVVVASDGQIYRSTSSLKYKDNIQDYSKGLSEVLQLRPVTYNSKNPNESGITYAGLIAEEVHDLGLTEFVQYAEDGTPDALAYQNMVALLTKAIQELSAKVTALENKTNP